MLFKLTLITTLATIPTFAGFVPAFVQGNALFSPPGDTIFIVDAAIGSANSNVAGSWVCDTCAPFGFSASGAGQSNFGVLGSMVTMSVPNALPGDFILARTNAMFVDNLTITGGSGQGVLALSFAINGSVSTTGAAGGPLGTTASLAMCLSDGCNDPNVYSSLNGGAITQSTQPGFRSDATITFYVPFTYGTTFEIEPFLATQAQFIPGDGTPFTTTANFNSTAHLTSALVLGGTSNAPGSIMNGTAIGSDAGFTYGPNGLVAGVPEPGTAWLATSGLGLVLLVSRLRNRKIRTIG
jgi:hypothetical protein